MQESPSTCRRIPPHSSMGEIVLEDILQWTVPPTAKNCCRCNQRLLQFIPPRLSSPHPEDIPESSLCRRGPGCLRSSFVLFSRMLRQTVFCDYTPMHSLGLKYLRTWPGLNVPGEISIRSKSFSLSSGLRRWPRRFIKRFVDINVKTCAFHGYVGERVPVGTPFISREVMQIESFPTFRHRKHIGWQRTFGMLNSCDERERLLR